MTTGGEAAGAARALELAYRYVTRRERTAHELRQYLLEHDLDSSAVEAAIQELVETGYVDDARFARLFVQDKRELQHWGGGRIQRALVSHGIESELAGAALGESGVSGELERAMALLRRRFPDPPRERRDRERALGVLLRRGYEPDLALDALNAYARAGS